VDFSPTVVPVETGTQHGIGLPKSVRQGSIAALLEASVARCGKRILPPHCPIPCFTYQALLLFVHVLTHNFLICRQAIDRLQMRKRMSTRSVRWLWVKCKLKPIMVLTPKRHLANATHFAINDAIFTQARL
jgi:hypothetical protein